MSPAQAMHAELHEQEHSKPSGRHARVKDWNSASLTCETCSQGRDQSESCIRSATDCQLSKVPLCQPAQVPTAAQSQRSHYVSLLKLLLQHNCHRLVVQVYGLHTLTEDIRLMQLTGVQQGKGRTFSCWPDHCADLTDRRSFTT